MQTKVEEDPEVRQNKTHPPRYTHWHTKKMYAHSGTSCPKCVHQIWPEYNWLALCITSPNTRRIRHGVRIEWQDKMHINCLYEFREEVPEWLYAFWVCKPVDLCCYHTRRRIGGQGLLGFIWYYTNYRFAILYGIVVTSIFYICCLRMCLCFCVSQPLLIDLLDLWSWIFAWVQILSVKDRFFKTQGQRSRSEKPFLATGGQLGSGRDWWGLGWVLLATCQLVFGSLPKSVK